MSRSWPRDRRSEVEVVRRHKADGAARWLRKARRRRGDQGRDELKEPHTRREPPTRRRLASVGGYAVVEGWPMQRMQCAANRDGNGGTAAARNVPG